MTIEDTYALVRRPYTDLGILPYYMEVMQTHPQNSIGPETQLIMTQEVSYFCQARL